MMPPLRISLIRVHSILSRQADNSLTQHLAPGPTTDPMIVIIRNSHCQKIGMELGNADVFLILLLGTSSCNAIISTIS